MLKPLTERQKVLIVNNIVKACQNIELLNKTGYNYLYQCSGFIAHYDFYGFRAEYNDGLLRADIMHNEPYNRWTNFRPGDQNYNYYMAKADVYARIVKRIS